MGSLRNAIRGEIAGIVSAIDMPWSVSHTCPSTEPTAAYYRTNRRVKSTECLGIVQREQNGFRRKFSRGLGHPVKGFLAGTGRRDGGWICRKFQMAEDLADDLALRDDGDEP